MFFVVTTIKCHTYVSLLFSSIQSERRVLNEEPIFMKEKSKRIELVHQILKDNLNLNQIQQILELRYKQCLRIKKDSYSVVSVYSRATESKKLKFYFKVGWRFYGKASD